MIYTLTFNPSIDLIEECNNFILGETNRTTREKILPGGKGINVSIVLNNLGLDTTVLGFIAGFTGEEIRRLISLHGIKSNFIQLNHGYSRINLKLKSNVETELNGNGPDIDLDAINKLYPKLDLLVDNDILVLAGNVPSQISPTIYSDIMQYLKEKNIKIVVDATKDLLRNTLEHKPFLIKPNLSELKEFFNTNINTQDDVIYYAKKLQEFGAQNVLVSLGKDGALLIDANHKLHQCSAPNGKAINTVGAGDSMIAGFLYGLLNNHSYEEAFKYSIASGSASAFSSELATANEIHNLYRKLSEELKKEVR